MCTKKNCLLKFEKLLWRRIWMESIPTRQAIPTFRQLQGRYNTWNYMGFMAHSTHTNGSNLSRTAIARNTINGY